MWPGYQLSEANQNLHKSRFGFGFGIVDRQRKVDYADNEKEKHYIRSDGRLGAYFKDLLGIELLMGHHITVAIPARF